MAPSPSPSPLTPHPRRPWTGPTQVTYSRSGGAGGQNVNKVATKAEVRLSLVEAAAWIPPNVLASLYKTSANRISNEQVLVITSSRFRTQGANTKDALDRYSRRRACM